MNDLKNQVLCSLTFILSMKLTCIQFMLFLINTLYNKVINDPNIS